MKGRVKEDPAHCSCWDLTMVGEPLSAYWEEDQDGMPTGHHPQCEHYQRPPPGKSRQDQRDRFAAAGLDSRGRPRLCDPAKESEARGGPHLGGQPVRLSPHVLAELQGASAGAPQDALAVLEEWTQARRATITLPSRPPGEDAVAIVTIGGRTEEGRGLRLRDALEAAMLRHQCDWRL